jgi:hypothetical protein
MSDRLKLAAKAALVLFVTLGARASAEEGPVQVGGFIEGKPPSVFIAGNMKVLRTTSPYCIVRDRGYCLYKPAGALGSPCNCDKLPGRFGG